ncbi:MAG TPA: TetR/AcrR family transcriptional regulator [Micropepsaceae bacterium]|nr:TetR/AcrR family transcriptional regulator [Micropepsaceae bacterium]
MAAGVSVNTSDASKGRRPSDSRARLLAAARKLFVERGYHDTRPQDISREAGLGHGTFYLHFADKRACFLAFQEEARNELDAAVRAETGNERSLSGIIHATLRAIFTYAETHPHVLLTAMADEAIISAAGGAGRTLVDRWSDDWAQTLSEMSASGLIDRGIDVSVVSPAVIGAIHQAASSGYRAGKSRDALLEGLTTFLTKALKPQVSAP